MQHIAIEAQPRGNGATKGDRKRQRRAGHIPAAVFGRDMEPVLVTVEACDLARILNSEAGTNTLVDLSLGDARHLVKLTEVDLDPIARTFLHVGLHRIGVNDQIKSMIPVEIVGEPEAVRLGTAMLDVAANEVEVRSLPDDMISTLTLDVSDMEVGDVRFISDLVLPDNLEMLTPPDMAIVSLHNLRSADAAESAAEEPEVVPADEPATK